VAVGGREIDGYSNTQTRFLHPYTYIRRNGE
jgi:hypothetical protein